MNQPRQLHAGKGTRHGSIRLICESSLTAFLDDGRVEIDSNAVKNLIRPLTLQRKNSLFAGHDEGAANWACIVSLIETCKINGVAPFADLVATLEAIAAGHPQSGIDDLKPWGHAAASSSNA